MTDRDVSTPDETTRPLSADPGEAAPGAAEQHPRVVTPDGTEISDGEPVAQAEADAQDGDDASRIEEPAKVMRIGGMIKRLLDEVRDAPLDDAARTRLAEIHERSIHELEDGLSPDLVDELHRITLPFSDEAVPSDAELRVAQAQLVGWLEGLFHGIQTALVAQQMAAQAQLSQMRRQLPPGAHPAPFGPGGPEHARPEDGRPAPGHYL
jgi:hypothetical protein